MVTDLADSLKVTTESIVGTAEKQPNLGVLCGTREQEHLDFLKVRAEWHSKKEDWLQVHFKSR